MFPTILFLTALVAAEGSPSGWHAPRPTGGHVVSNGSNQAPRARDVDAVQVRLGQAQYELRPWLAHEGGWNAVGLELGHAGAGGMVAWRTALESALRDLESFDRTRLPAKRRAEHESLAAWIRAEVTLLQFQSPAQTDPVHYVDRVERTLRAVLATDALTPRERTQEITLILQGIPEYWQEARQSLSTPTHAWCSEAMPRLVDLGLWMQHELTQAMGVSAWPKKQKTMFRSRLLSAIQSTKEFRDWLAETPAQEGRTATPLEHGAWERIVAELTGSELTAEELKSTLLRDVASLDLWLLPRDGAGDYVEEEYAPREMAPLIHDESRRALDLAIEADLLLPKNPQRTRLGVQAVRALSQPGPAVRSRQGKQGSSWLDVEPRGVLWTPAERETRARLFTPAGLRAIAVRHGFPGEMLVRLEVMPAGNKPTATILNRATLEGWGLYVLDWLPRVKWVENAYEKDPEFRSAAAYALTLEAARLLLGIEVHHEHLSVQEAADAFARRTGFDPESALLEAREALHDPLHGIGYLGYLELKSNEAKLAASSAPEIALLNMVRFTLMTPHLRPVDMRNNLFPFVR